MLERSKYLVITSDYVLPGLIIVSVLALSWICFYSSVFALKTIDCQMDYQPCQNTALEAEINKNLGVNIFRLNEAQVTTRILSGEYTVRSVELKRILPSHLSVSLQSVYPSLAVVQSGDPRYVTLDDHYRVISVREQDPNVVTLHVPVLPPLQVGQIISGDLIPVFKLSQAVSSSLSKIKDLTLRSDGSLLVSLEDSPTAIMSPSVDVDKQIRLLQAVLSDPTIIKGKSEIDIRFSQPILK